LFDLADHGISLVGELPAGLPGFDIPDVRRSDLSALLAGAAGIAVVATADTSVLSRTLAMRERDDVDPNQELIATGAVNIATGLFQGFPVSSSASRTPVAAEAGARTQLTGVVGAAAIIAVLVWAPGLFRNLPSSVLAAIVIAAAMSLVEIRGLVRLARVRPAEFIVSVVALAGVAVLGVIPGIGIAVGLSLLAFIRRAWVPHTAELVRVDGLKGYHDVNRHPEGLRVPELALLRFDAPLFFANADVFKRTVLRLARDPERRIRWIVVAAEPITDVDVTAAQALSDVLDELDEAGIVLAFAEMKGPVRERLAATGLVDRIGPERFYPTIGQAVRTSVTATGASWTDWEDRTPGQS
jgi:MFS superfamily sulfate permease-like transporter